MKNYMAGLSITAVLLLAGCGAAEESKEENTESKVQANTPALEGADHAEAEKEAVLASPYKEIKEHFDNYELPKEGIVKVNEGKDFGSTIEYENGYTFKEDTKALVSRVYDKDGNVSEPMEGQETGVVMGWIQDAAALGEYEGLAVSNDPNLMGHPISRLKQIEELTMFEPLSRWAEETAALLDKAQKNEDETERQKLLKEGYDKLQEMNSIIEGQ